MAGNPVFQKGHLLVENLNDSSSAPKPVLITTPIEGGEYPVILFFHGYCLGNTYYTELFTHISSHGYIIVAPQLYVSPCAMDDLENAAMVTNWLSKGLQSTLPKNVPANLTKFALAGHSRGGKVAFTLALGLAQISLKFSVLIGIDPVAGFSKCVQFPQPPILSYVPCSFNIASPILVVGTGLGSEKKNCVMAPCAPNGVNHKEFYNESRPPCYHFVTTDYGHMDMLNDNIPNVTGKIASCICKSGPDKEPMRRCAGGLVVAFLEAYFERKSTDLDDIVANPGIAPVELNPVEYKMLEFA